MTQPSQSSEELARQFLENHASLVSPEYSSTARYKSNRIQVNWLANAFTQAIQTAQAADKARILELESTIHTMYNSQHQVQTRIQDLESTILALSEALEEVKIHHDPSCKNQYCIWLAPHIVEFINKHNNKIDKALKAAHPTIKAERQRVRDEAIDEIHERLDSAYQSTELIIGLPELDSVHELIQSLKKKEDNQ